MLTRRATTPLQQQNPKVKFTPWARAACRHVIWMKLTVLHKAKTKQEQINKGRKKEMATERKVFTTRCEYTKKSNTRGNNNAS